MTFLLKRLILCTFLLGIIFTSFQFANSTQGSDIEKKIIGLEKAALDLWGKGNPDGFLALNTPNVTYFDPFIDKRLDGFDSLKEMYESLRGKIKLHRYEMVNPKVQTNGNMAVLTFNFISYKKLKDGSEKISSSWHTTEVYKKIEGNWKIISTHWSFNKSQLDRIKKNSK